MTKKINRQRHNQLKTDRLFTIFRSTNMALLILFSLIWAYSTPVSPVYGKTLKDILNTGKIRHLGIPYANFISNQGSGLDVELMKQFAAYLGVEYEFVESTWNNIIPDLTGKQIIPRGNDVEITGASLIRGDVIATGFTILPWRKKIVDFSTPTFPTGVWLIARADSALKPITPTGEIEKDIVSVKSSLKGNSVLALKDSCLDPELYHMEKTGALIKLFNTERDLDEMIPAVIAGMADTTLMDIPVALIALEKWSGKIKVVGPISLHQNMAVAFDKSAPELRAKFEEFFTAFKTSGTYSRLVNKYYPTVTTYYPDFFKN